jgi:hypothetical protein
LAKALRIWAGNYKRAEYRNGPPMEKKPSNKASKKMFHEYDQKMIRLWPEK